MAHILRVYTPPEAAAVTEIAVKAVHNAIDKRIIARRLAENVGGGHFPTMTCCG